MNTLFGDFIKIFNLQLDWLIVIAVNIPMTIRIFQCSKRYRETGKSYPHIVNLFKGVSSFPATLNNLNYVKNNLFVWRFVTSFNFIQTIFKYYWDLCEDWSMFFGGSGRQEKLSHK